MNYINPFTLQGKNILITGATSGIGRECAIVFDQLGANLVLIGRSKSRLNDLAELLNKEYHIFIDVDITDYDMIKSKLSSLDVIFDGVIHSAGISTTIPLKNITPEKIEPYMHTNVYASIQLTQLICSLKHRNKEGMSIVFISSVMGVVGEIGKTIYSLTKGALIAGSKSLALELASKKIRVNTISPGVVETPMSGTAVYSNDEESYNRVKKLHPLGLGNPKDIANACVFLISDASRWITGTNLIVDGGYTCK
ncbi:SDR family oxidoreductase [Empedobacter falsenii]